MKIETTVYLTRAELDQPVTLTLANGSEVTIVVKDEKTEKPEPKTPGPRTGNQRRWNGTSANKLYCAPCEKEFKYKARLLTHQAKVHGVKFIDGEDADV